MEKELKKYKQVTCRQMGGSCDEVFRAATEEQVIFLALDHACFGHRLCETTDEGQDRIRSLIVEVWA